MKHVFCNDGFGLIIHLRHLGCLRTDAYGGFLLSIPLDHRHWGSQSLCSREASGSERMRLSYICQHPGPHRVVNEWAMQLARLGRPEMPAFLRSHHLSVR